MTPPSCLYGARGRLYWCETHRRDSPGKWAANVCDIVLDCAEGIGVLTIEKGPADMLPRYVEAVAARKRPHIQLRFDIAKSHDRDDGVSAVYASVSLPADVLARYLDDPSDVTNEVDLPIRWAELTMLREF